MMLVAFVISTTLSIVAVVTLMWIETVRHA